jgi:hypothetical protein
MFIVVGLVCGTIPAAVLSGIGLGEWAFIGFIIGMVHGMLVGSASSVSIRIGKGIWLHYKQ